MSEIKSDHLKALGIPEDVISKAESLGVDMKDLGKLIVEHSVQAARDFLTYLKTKLPSK